MSDNINKYKDLFTPASILIAGILISGSLMYTNGAFQNDVVSGGALAAQAGNTASPAPPPSGGGDGGGESVGSVTITSDDHIRGNPDAAVTIVEFSDFQCPFCQRFHPTVKQALAEYGDQVRWVYKHFPLSQIHPEAIASAEASECVAAQKGNDGFWQFADALFENPARLAPAYYREVAGTIGVDLAQYDTCVKERTYKEKVEQHQAEGFRAGITGTPGGFVNDQPLRGAIPYAQLKTMIDAELQ